MKNRTIEPFKAVTINGKSVLAEHNCLHCFRYLQLAAENSPLPWTYLAQRRNTQGTASFFEQTSRYGLAIPKLGRSVASVNVQAVPRDNGKTRPLFFYSQTVRRRHQYYSREAHPSVYWQRGRLCLKISVLNCRLCYALSRI